jgi:hypothetical protein
LVSGVLCFGRSLFRAFFGLKELILCNDRRSIALVVLAIFVFHSAIESSCYGEIIQWQAMNFRCRKEIDGVMYEVDVAVLLYPEGATNGSGWGFATKYTGEDSDKVNCNGQKYDHMKMQIDHNWTAGYLVNGQVHVFTHADNKAYWDHYYRDYEAPASCDYTMNCHGFAFDVGDCPMTAVKLVSFSPAQLPPPGQLPPPPPPPNCYVPCPPTESEIYCDLQNHTIKTIRSQCPGEEHGGPGTTTTTLPGGEPPFEQPGTIGLITDTQEQFLESGTYKRTTDCENCFQGNAAVLERDLAFAHRRAMRPYLFQYYKKNVE